MKVSLSLPTVFPVLALLVLVGTVLMAEKQLPGAGHADAYLLHESHHDELVTIAIDPYWEEEQQAYFKTNFRKHLLLPVRLVITNDRDEPISLRNLNIEFITARREKAEPASVDDIERRIASPISKSDSGGGPSIPLPIPLPRKKPKRVDRKVEDELANLLFQAKAVEPHNTQSGFVFFDVLGMADPLAGTHIYISGIKASGRELFYFDLPLRKAEEKPVP